MRIVILLITLIYLVLSHLVPAAVGSEQGPSVVVYFDSNKALLEHKEKAKLRHLFKTYDVTGAGRVFVLGFTDSRGKKNKNYDLSRKRARAVRREIISSFGVEATVVMALGKGSENPVADNDKARGRAQNRRVEVYLANPVVRRPKRVYGPKDPHLPKITTLVEEADALIRERRIEPALKKLQQAHAIGGDHYSDWHTVMGIAGFYAGISQAQSHLATAVQLDPYNFKAREFLSRLEARQKVASGQVTAQMGQSAKKPIAVSAAVQAHEYLRLFNVEPVAYREMESQPIHVWECVDEKGRSVVYYFNYAPIYGWAFGLRSALSPSEMIKARQQIKVAQPKRGSKAKAPQPLTGGKAKASLPPSNDSTKAPAPVRAPEQQPESAPEQQPESVPEQEPAPPAKPADIWESRVFK